METRRNYQTPSNINSRPNSLADQIHIRSTDLNTEVSIPIPSGYALRRFREFQKTSKESKDILLNHRLVHKPKGNKKWEIELSFFHVLTRFGRYMIGKPFQGSLSCHRTGNFTTYAVNIAGREFWFDQFELAIASMAKNRMQLWRNGTT